MLFRSREASVRLHELGFDNARVIHGDGLAPQGDIGVFDRVLIDGAVDEVPAEIIALLARDGAVIFAREDGQGGCALVRKSDEKDAGLRDQTLIPVRAIAMAREKSTTF